MTGQLGRAAVGALTMVLVVGCGTGSPPSGPPSEPVATNPATAEPSSQPTGPLASPTPDPLHRAPWIPSAVTAAEAWGDTFDPIWLPVHIGSDRHFQFASAATSDGRYLIGTSQPDAFRAVVPVYEAPTFAVLYEVATGDLIQMAELTTRSSQMLSADSDGDWVVWTEADDVRSDQDPSFWNWRIRAYNLVSREVREIVRAARKDGEAVPGWVSEVSVSHDHVVWGQARLKKVEGRWTADTSVRGADLVTGSVSTLATSARNPVVSWPWVVWAVDAEDGAEAGLATNLETGDVRTLDRVRELALAGASVATSELPGPLSIWLVEDLGSSARAVEIARGVMEHLERPSLNDRIVGWIGTAAKVVYDRAQRRLVSLPMPDGSFGAVTVAGPLMIWAETDASSLHQGWPDRLVVADTATLAIDP